MAIENATTTVELTADKKLLLNAKDVQSLLGISVDTLRRNGGIKFPAPVDTCTSRVVWRRSDIEKWVESLPSEK